MDHAVTRVRIQVRYDRWMKAVTRELTGCELEWWDGRLECGNEEISQRDRRGLTSCYDDFEWLFLFIDLIVINSPRCTNYAYHGKIQIGVGCGNVTSIDGQVKISMWVRLFPEIELYRRFSDIFAEFCWINRFCLEIILCEIHGKRSSVQSYNSNSFALLYKLCYYR